MPRVGNEFVQLEFCFVDKVLKENFYTIYNNFFVTLGEFKTLRKFV